MKATINEYGELKITAENELEAYALNRWCKDNIHECTGEVKKESLLLDWNLNVKKEINA